MLYKVAESSKFSLLLAKNKTTRSLYVYIFVAFGWLVIKEAFFLHIYSIFNKYLNIYEDRRASARV